MTSSHPFTRPSPETPGPQPVEDPGAELFEQYTKDFGMYLAGTYGQFVGDFDLDLHVVGSSLLG